MGDNYLRTGNDVKKVIPLETILQVKLLPQKDCTLSQSTRGCMKDISTISIDTNIIDRIVTGRDWTKTTVFLYTVQGIGLLYDQWFMQHILNARDALKNSDWNNNTNDPISTSIYPINPLN
jgi:hypothetical protein